MNRIHDIGVATRIDAYSDAIEVAPDARWLAVSGTPGMASDGTIPSSFDEQAEQAWSNVRRAKAGFTVGDLVKVTQ